MDLRELCLNVCTLANSAGAFIKEQAKVVSSSDVELKGYNNFVTYVDKESEKMITDGLKTLLPGAAFIVEENTIEMKDGDYIWVVDPLDGTTNFIHGLPIYSISIALLSGDEIILGVVLEVNREECFYAWKGSPAYLNGRVINVSDAAMLKDSLLVTGFPYCEYDKLDKYMQVFDFALRNTHGLRRLGSAAADLAYVACGRFDLFFEYGLSPWDVAAGALIVKQAGGRVGDFSGGDNFIFGKEIIASNDKIYNSFVDVSKSIFKS